MKKILTSLTLLGAVAGGAYAQANIDFEGLITGTSDSIVSCDPNDSFTVQFAIVNHGPDGLSAGDDIAVQGPWNEIGFASGYTLQSDLPAGDTLFLTQSLHSADFQTLYDPEADSIAPAPFTTGKVYGYYFNVAQFEDSPYDDTATGNNITAVGVYWCSTTPTGITDVNHTKTSLNIYPNPANTNVSVKYDFTKTTEAGIRVVDVTGRTVINNNLGKQAAGEKVFTVDISSLAPGMYTVELVTDDVRAISKLTVTK